MPSNLLQQLHAELCPEISIDSEKFTFRLIDEISRLKQELKGEGGSRIESRGNTNFSR